MIRISPVEASDYPRLASFLACFPGETRPEAFWRERFDGFWDKNPAFDGTSPRGWVVREADGGIGGFLGVVPMAFQWNGRPGRVLGATTLRVLPRCKGGGVKLYARHVLEEGSRDFLVNTTANLTVERILSYLGFSVLSSHRTDRVFLLPVDSPRATRAFLKGRLARVPDALAGVPLGLASLPAWLALGRPRFRVLDLPSADGRFDELWSRTRHVFANTAIRSSAAIEWMCFARPSARKVLLGCFHGTTLRGWAIFAEAIWRGASVLELVDLWTDSSRSEVARALVRGAWRVAKRRGIAVLSLYDFEEGDSALLRRMGLFLTSPSPRKHHLRAPGDPGPKVTLRDARLSGLEGDRFL